MYLSSRDAKTDTAVIDVKSTIMNTDGLDVETGQAPPARRRRFLASERILTPGSRLL